MPEGAQFVSRSFACAAGIRIYKLYMAASAADRPRGLIVMLHGCKQDPDDFATGTNMNAVAETHGLLVAYPAQPGSANASSCWNWFNPADQGRGAGEPSILAGITRELMSEFGLERDEVFMVGLSAGGAMAVVMGETYPDLYSAIGIHSGLPYRSANDVMSAFAAMRGEAVAPSRGDPRYKPKPEPTVRSIVFHGSADPTVNPANANKILETVAWQLGPAKTEAGRALGGRTYTRSIYPGSNGAPAVEFWMIQGAGHAWSGGDPAGSYTDPTGPDASAEMVRFFLAH
jgi:poly(hydroxyalkanoate) depolymerase family esterase